MMYAKQLTKSVIELAFTDDEHKVTSGRRGFAPSYRQLKQKNLQWDVVLFADKDKVLKVS